MRNIMDGFAKHPMSYDLAAIQDMARNASLSKRTEVTQC